MAEIAVRSDAEARPDAAEAGALSLRILASQAVLLHEGVEERRVAELAERLERDGILKNPPVVAALRADPESDGRFVVLDGATRVEALRRLNVRDVLAQVVDLDRGGLALESWRHLIIGISPDRLLRDLERLEGIAFRAMLPHEAEAALERRELLCYLLLPGDAAQGAIVAPNGASQARLLGRSEAGLLSKIVATYQGKTPIFRVASLTLEELLRQHESVSALVVFPRFPPEEVLSLATREAKLPTGITRFVIPGRVLRVDFPLEILRSATPREVKNGKLEAYIRERLRRGRVRSYQESVILFDE